MAPGSGSAILRLRLAPRATIQFCRCKKTSTIAWLSFRSPLQQLGSVGRSRSCAIGPSAGFLPLEPEPQNLDTFTWCHRECTGRLAIRVNLLVPFHQVDSRLEQL